MSDPKRDPNAPLRISHYDIGDMLGTGGMGTVYRGVDRRSGVTLAIKLVHPHLQEDPSYVERFRREAHLASLLKSPYVVRLLDFGFEDGRYFMALEYVQGVKLSDILKEQGRLAPLQALAIALQIALALDEAEGRGVVHRDIKPDNIILTTVDRSVKVLDFGIARQTGIGGVTQTGLFVGTLAYSAPEQFLGHADTRTDIYALGVLLFQMLAGAVPFQAATPTGLMRLHEDAPPPLERLAALPTPVLDVIVKCMEKKPEDRYQHMSEVLAAIEAARLSLTGAATEAWMTDATSVLLASQLRAGPDTQIIEDDATKIAPAAGSRDSEATAIASSGSAASADATTPPPSPPAPLAGSDGGAGGGAGAAAPRPAASGGGRGSQMLLIGGAIAVTAALAIGATAFFLTRGDGGPSERELRFATRTALAREERRTSVAATKEAGTPTPSISDTPTVDGFSFVNTGTWNISFVATSNDCPFGIAVGNTLDTSFDLFESPFDDGFLDVGELASISEPGGEFIPDQKFSYPEFVFQWSPSAPRADVVTSTIFTTFTFSAFDTATVTQSEFYDIDEDGDGVSDTICLIELEEAA